MIDPTRPLTLLHLSELRFGRGGEAADTLAARLAADLAGLRVSPDLVVVTGDLSETARPSELREALRCLARLAEVLRLPRHRVVLVPGDRDVNLDACAAYWSDCQAAEQEPVPPYRPKWRTYAAAIQGFHDGSSAASGSSDTAFSERVPWNLIELPDLRLAVAALNSTVAESHRPEDHYGFLGTEQLHWFAERLEPYRGRGWITAAALHHPVYALRDADALREILGGRLDLILHGQADGVAIDRLTPDSPSAPGAPVVAAGQPEDDTSSLHHYRVLRLEPGQLSVRGRALPAGRDIPAVAEGIEIQGYASFPVAAFPPEDGPSRRPGDRTEERPGDGPEERLEESSERDDFLARVEAACRIREPGAEVRRMRDGWPPIEYLRVSRSEGGMARLYPVGILEQGADAADGSGTAGLASLAAFTDRIDAAYREADSGLVSILVYGGDKQVSPELVRTAAARRIRLMSFPELQGLIDFRAYVERQSARLRQDPVYPPSLYVPQRMRFAAGRHEEETGDAAATLLDWLASPHGRFILAVGDSGTGKSFLLRELARRLAGQGGLIPILIELRHLEKVRSLDQLLGQHFAREGVEDFSPGRFRYMLEQGRIALFFDGFDELATRVTYARAAEHFDTLLQAAAGAAKVVVTSRRQHFESESQVKTLLGEQVDRLSGRRMALLQPFDREQIRAFLVRLTGDETLGAERLAMLEQVGDLLGLAHNPRMLAFIAELPEERLRRARTMQGEITPASLYRLLLSRWLGQELDRAHPESLTQPPLLSFSERLEAVTRVALRLWRREDPSLDLADLTEEVGRAVAGLRRGPIDAEAAAFQVGSGTLLVRDEGGSFSFLHPSILEWLVARRASEELAMNGPAETLALRDMSPLMADFFVALAGRETSLAWARRALLSDVQDGRDGRDVRDATKGNAFLVLRRLGEEMREPVNLAGRDLRGKDLSGEELAGADLTAADLSAARLVGARLTAARLTRARLRDADLSNARLDGADLRDAELTGARLLGADLRGARLDGAVLRRAKLIGSLRGDASLESSDLTGAALAVPPQIEASVDAALPCHAIAWSPDGDLLATGEGRLVRLWEVATGRELRRLTGHEGTVSAVAWSPDGRLLASASHDRTVRLWEPATGRERARLWGHTSWVSSVAFQPAAGLAGGLLASASYDRTARLWDLRTGRETRSLPGHGSWVLSVAWSPDGQRLATGCADGTIRLWSPATADLTRELRGHEDWVRSIAFGASGLLASAAEDRTVRIWETATGRELHRLTHLDKVHAVAWSPDGTALASASEDRTVRLWDPRTGREERRGIGHTGSLHGIAWSPDGKLLATGSSDRTLRIWNAAILQEVRRFPGQEHWVSGLAFGPGGVSLAAASHDGIARLWDVRTGRQTRRFREPGQRLWGIAFRADGWTLAGACEDGTVALWSVVDPGTDPPAVRRLEGHQGRVFAVAWSHDGTALASGSADRTVRLWNAATGRELHRLAGAASGVRALAWSPDGYSLAAASGDPVLRLWDTGTGDEIRRLSGHESNALSVAWSPDGRSLAAGCIDGATLCWDLASGDETHRFKGHTESVWALAWSPDGRHLASGSFDGTVRLWDLTMGIEAHRFDAHAHRVLSLAWSPDGTLLASGSADNTIRLWDIATGRCRAVLGLLAEGWAAFTPDGRYKLGGLPAGGFWHTIGLCRFEPGELDPWAPGLRMEDEEGLG
ncbi:MAG TPA: pentapeptide repeat-containing protein [Thermoanaerobaculia bacterium]|jgi:WD40 repeat protein|nr:pentapeptide repeat-containing protein [Thermoanaerobaculia bacterium]